MYRFYFFLFCAIICASCGKKYKIEGNSSVSKLDGKMLFIKVPSGDKLVNIDSAEVVHGIFKMKGKVDSTVIASLYMDDDCIMPVVIEEGNISINIDKAGFSVKGTPLNDSFNEFIIKKTSLEDRAYEVERMESRMIMDGKDPKFIQEEMEKQRTALGNDIYPRKLQQCIGNRSLSDAMQRISLSGLDSDYGGNNKRCSRFF